MYELLEEYVDSSFVEALVQLSPAVGVGIVMAMIVAIVGWCVGFVIRASKVEL